MRITNVTPAVNKSERLADTPVGGWFQTLGSDGTGKGSVYFRRAYNEYIAFSSDRGGSVWTDAEIRRGGFFSNHRGRILPAGTEITVKI
jgi:hypothetical protein